MAKIFSIGYAGLSQEAFLALLEKHQIQCIADVRSSPYSKAFPNYNKENMPVWLKSQRIHYVYLGAELGPRSNESSHYDNNGQVQFDRLSQTPQFDKGIRRLENGAQKMNVAIMCAEKDPMTCHRSLLVAEYSKTSQLEFSHIMQDGSLETQQEMVDRAMKTYQITPDMFTPLEECRKSAHKKLCSRYAYSKPEGQRNNQGGFNR
ncbi:DUF488 domain-containing protein [Pseudomonas syringae pv. actinidiae]|nr:DUF488 domain-containing protein [Pseudomonas syringae pv. actinidiae]